MAKRLTRRKSAPALAAVSEHEPLSTGSSASDVTEEEAQVRKYQARLRAFYWAHDPRQVDKVEEILERQKGKEEAFLQRVHMQFGVRDFSGETAIDDLYEHERYSYFSFSYGSSFPGHLLPTDRRRWGALHGAPSSQTRERVEPQLPVNWVWTSQWEVDTHTGNCDKDGWIYAFDFTMINSAMKRSGGRSEPRATDYVRRRRWIRHRQRVVVAPPAPLAAAPVSSPQESEVEGDDDDDDDGEDGESDDGDGNNNSRCSRRRSSAKRIEDVVSDLNVDDDDADEDDGGYDEDDEATNHSGTAITSGGASNQDDARALPSPPLSIASSELKSALPALSPTLQSILGTAPAVAPAATATGASSSGATTGPANAGSADPELQIYSLAMDKSAVDTAWATAVKELEALYTRAKVHRVQQTKLWGVRREKLKRQIHLLEKTIASMESVALDEEKRRRMSASANSSPRKSFVLSPLGRDRSGGESTGATGAGATGMGPSPRASGALPRPEHRNAVNVLNLAAKIQSAQSKLDALKRLLWHPREKRYTLRFSIDGIFYGLRDFHVESLRSRFAIHMNHQTNGAQGITPTCKIELRGHTVCCGQHVKVTGDKGTRVPKSIWDRMYLDTDFEASVYLIYVEDLAGGTGTGIGTGASTAREGVGHWEFLCTPESTRVELLNFSRRVHGGLDLPEPVVRKLCADVLSSLVRDLALIYFPQELAVAFDAPPAKLDLEGSVAVTGVPIDDVLEREIELIRDTRIGTNAAGAGVTERDDSTKSLLAAAAAQLLAFPHSDESMKRIAATLQLAPAQFNLLVALKDCALYPAPYSFKTIAGMCEYYARFFVDERPEGDADGTHALELRTLWRRVLELLYIRKMRALAGTSTSAGASEAPMFALFDVDALFTTIERLTKKPAALELTVTRMHCSVKALSVVEALAKLYERLVLGVDFSKPRTGYDTFIYGFRFGRKAPVPRAVVTAVAEATGATSTSASASTAAPAAPTAHGLDPRLHVQLDATFRARLKAFSQFFRSLKALLVFAKQNMESVSAELAGRLAGTGSDCDLAGSFKDVEFVGPVHVELAIPACFLGLYRAETVALDGDGDGSSVGLQIELMLPKAQVSRRRRAAQRKQKQLAAPAPAALEAVGRVVVSDISTEVLIDVDALVEQHRIRSASAAAELTAPWSPTKSFARRVATEKTNAKHRALAFSFSGARTDDDDAFFDLGERVTRVNSGTSELRGGGSTASGAIRRAKLKLHASEFTKLHASVRSGSFATRVLPVLNWLIANQLRPRMQQQASPEHQALFDALLASLLQWLSSPTMALDFDVFARAFLHDHDDLMFTLGGAPLHATPVVFKDELLLLPLILQVDDLVNQWIDDRYPPYANPLYF